MPLFSEKGSATILEPLPFAEWQQRPAWPAVSLGNTDPVEDLAPHVGRLRLIVLNFPKFSDGRAYSQARLLRGRMGYTGELRAIGGVLQDQHHPVVKEELGGEQVGQRLPQGGRYRHRSSGVVERQQSHCPA